MNSLFGRVFLRGLVIGTVLAVLTFGTLQLMKYMESKNPPDDASATADAMKERPMLYMDIPGGRVTIELLPDVAPRHVARITELAAQGFYDGVAFHRVVEDFVAQGGDPTGTGRGGSGQHIPAEFSQTEKHVRGAVSMARTADPNSADSQFFIVLADSFFLDGQYTIWGRVTEGMEHVDALKRGEGHSDPDRIVRMRPADAKE